MGSMKDVVSLVVKKPRGMGSAPCTYDSFGLPRVTNFFGRVRGPSVGVDITDVFSQTDAEEQKVQVPETMEVAVLNEELSEEEKDEDFALEGIPSHAKSESRAPRNSHPS